MAASVPLPSEEPPATQAAEDVDMGFDDAVKVLNASALHNHPVRSEKLRQQARGRRENNAHVRLAKFALGDFVLLGKSIKFPTKLALNSKGPYRVSRVDSDYVMEVQQLVETFATSVHHASRLKFFSDAALDVTDALVDYAAGACSAASAEVPRVPLEMAEGKPHLHGMVRFVWFQRVTTSTTG
ncbi:hypothetical protein DYB26_004630 [Aphanomyces astaci]|uniref:Uncharacterized protein n=1 Tax=Aphanomyces astaci TaxID=112090 RepID=A0A3R7BSC9_APHAT|nr:hypothetical protein DYB26_004630 [Aphanomyces astaci]